MSPLSLIQREIDELEEQDRRMQLELEDALNDVNTPPTSDTEDDEAGNEQVVYGPLTRYAAYLQAEMLSAPGIPTEAVSYGNLYQNPNYRRNADRKLKKVKRLVGRTNLDAIDHGDMWNSINRVRRMYPKLGGRRHLDLLIGLYSLLDTEGNMTDYSESEDDTDFDDDTDSDSGNDRNPRGDRDDDEGSAAIIEATGRQGVQLSAA
jgi:hypothetical protein